MRNKLLLIIFSILALPGMAGAHAFGQKYTLPIPAWLYIYGGGAVVIASFVLVGIFATTKSLDKAVASVDLYKRREFALIRRRGWIITLQIIGLIMLGLVIAAGVLGSEIGTINFAPIFFWLIFLLGFSYFVAIFGDWWTYLNPWKTISQWFVGDDSRYSLEKYGHTPALLFYFILIWVELVSGSAGNPQRLAMYLIFYSVLTFIGSFLFGVKQWFRYGDFFSVFFRLLSLVSPVEKRSGHLHLRWPFAGLLREHEGNFTLLMFVIFMLSSTAFDGFRDTTTAAAINLKLTLLGSLEAKQSLLLISFFVLFLAVYLFAIYMMKVVTRSSVATKELAVRFAFSLIPIAIAYHVAHYYTLLLVQGQSIIPALSDPFNMGWNLLGTALYEVNVGIIGAKSVWHTQVAVIVAGHVAAVYISHLMALNEYRSRRQALVSQLPMLAVMVAYTIAGLWILSQPLVLG